MPQPDDNLHDWIRQSLATYRPDYNPADWQRMQRRLRRRWWVRGAALVGSGLLLSTLGWLLMRPPVNGVVADVRSSTHSQPVPERPADTTSRSDAPASVLAGSVLATPVWTKKLVAGTRQSERQRRQTGFPPTAPMTPLTTVTPLPANLPDLANRSPYVRLSTDEAAIIRQVETGRFGSDSTSYRVLERNLARWPDAVIVCDFTSSMFPYTTQLVAWLRSQAKQPNVQGIVFFTDCDSLGRQTRPGGLPGQMFVSRGHDASAILPALLRAARNTTQNEDDAENDVEALLAAQRLFPEAKHLILVADNLSRVKDMARLPKLNKPVHVVLCGTTGGDPTLAFQPEFARIAGRTNGSLHTLEDDIDPMAIPKGETLRVGSYYYRYNARRKQFVLTPFQHRPRRFLGFLWL